ncbi:MAG: hypothetical protein R3E10_14720 [Gemmatimonadota bacterium]
MSARSKVIHALPVLLGLLALPHAVQAQRQDGRRFIDFSRPEVTLQAGLTFYEESPAYDIGLGGGLSAFQSSLACLNTGGVDMLDVDLMGGGIGFSAGYSRAGGWPWDGPTGGNGGPAGGGATQQASLGLTHGTAFHLQLLVRPTWRWPGLQGERLAWNVVGGIGIHRQTDGEPSSNVNGIPAWGIEGQTNLYVTGAVTTEYRLTSSVGVRGMARMHWMQRDDPVFLQPGGGTSTGVGDNLTWGSFSLGLTLRPGG